MAHKKVLHSSSIEKESTITITQWEFEDELQKAARALNGIRQLLEGNPQNFHPSDVASILAPIEDQLCDYVTTLETRNGESAESPLERGSVEKATGEERTVSITKEEFENHLSRTSRALHGIRAVLNAVQQVEAVDIAAMLAPLDDELCDFMEELEERFEKGGANEPHYSFSDSQID
jgi:hypothetical protein